jgi:hypothetical protein
VFGCLSLAYLREFSYYIPLDVPSPISYLPNGYWDEVLYIRKDFVDIYGRTFILRKEGHAYGAYNGYSFDTPENVMKYFDDHLANNGWKPISDLHAFYKCQDGLPEKKYIPELYYEEYIKVGDDPENTSKKICVAIIPMQRNSWETYDTFRVILISSQYSPLTEFLEAFRRM